VLIAQDRAEAEVAIGDGEISRSVHLRAQESSLRLEALGIDVGLAEALAGVQLAEAADVARADGA
jgi:hypothetical protein